VSQKLPQEIVQYVQQRCAEPALVQEITDLLVRVVNVDTTPTADVAVMAANEQKVFDILTEPIQTFGLVGVRLEDHPINPAIADHHYFTPIHYTKTAENPEGLGPADGYAGRHNVLVLVDGTDPDGPGRGLALNSHIDVVAPYYPATVDGDTICGRGSADAKGCVVAIVGALKLVGELQSRFGLKLNHDLTAMIVIEEEPGGNGSLSLAIDEQLKQRYDGMVVLEITSMKLHPANRGALWYRCELSDGGDPDVNLLEMDAFVTLAMEDEGAAIKSESEHALFPDRPVQTCHGILGPFGEHPAAVNDRIEFRMAFDTPVTDVAVSAVRGVLDKSLSHYIDRYGDKSTETDPDGEVKVPVHYELAVDGSAIDVTVLGKAGHMGAVLECDCSITKAAYFVRDLMAARAEVAGQGAGDFQLELTGHADGAALVAEGGQGFVPTHDLAQVGRRMREAVGRGVEAYAQATGKTLRADRHFDMSYDKLHNDAFDGDPDSETMQACIAAQKALGMWTGEPILGWKVSCDSRLFAKQYPGMPVVTFGPGLLADAHSEHEHIGTGELMQAIAMTTLAAVAHCGFTRD